MGILDSLLEVEIMVQQKAALNKRIVAFLIDWFAFCFLQSIISGILILSHVKSLSSNFLFSAILTATVITFSINLFRDSLQGISLGKRLMKLGVRREDNITQVPSHVKLVIRNLFILLWPIEALLLMAKGKRLGDIITKTDVYQL